jgi:hypothetical protein
MQSLLGPGLFATVRRVGQRTVDADALFSDALAVVIGLALYVSLRRWSANRESRAGVIACALVLLYHPIWVFLFHPIMSFRNVGVDKMIIWSVLAAICVWVCALSQWVRSGKPRDKKRASLAEPPDPRDTRFTAEPPPWPAPEPRPDKGTFARFLLATAYRLLAAFGVGLFAHAQYVWYVHERSAWLGNPEPNWALGPLYFLVNASPADDWIGYALLAVAVPCLLSVVVWPNRWTALVASLTAWAWVIPATVKAFLDPG